MRYTYSPAFNTARTEHLAAFAHANAMSAKYPDEHRTSKTSHDAEYRALDVMLMQPCRTPMDLLHKLRTMDDRELKGWDCYEAVRRQMDVDLRQMARPAASIEMAAAFKTWAEAREAIYAADERGIDDDDRAPYAEADHAAYSALMALPCITPGDFIVKAYINLIDDNGSTSHLANGWEYEPNTFSPRMPNATGNDDQYEMSVRRDLADTDIGRCMMVLGTVDFDAEKWIAAADRAGLKIYVVIELDGTCNFWNMLREEQEPTDFAGRESMTLALLAGGLGLSAERVAAVTDAIICNHMHRVIDMRDCGSALKLGHAIEAGATEMAA